MILDVILSGSFFWIDEKVCNVSPRNSISFGGTISILTSLRSISSDNISTVNGNYKKKKIDSGVIV